MKTLFYKRIGEEEVLLNHDGTNYWLSVNGEYQQPVVKKEYYNHPANWVVPVIIVVAIVEVLVALALF